MMLHVLKKKKHGPQVMKIPQVSNSNPFFFYTCALTEIIKEHRHRWIFTFVLILLDQACKHRQGSLYIITFRVSFLCSVVTVFWGAETAKDNIAIKLLT